MFLSITSQPGLLKQLILSGLHLAGEQKLDVDSPMGKMCLMMCRGTEPNKYRKMQGEAEQNDQEGEEGNEEEGSENDMFDVDNLLAGTKKKSKKDGKTKKSTRPFRTCLSNTFSYNGMLKHYVYSFSLWCSFW